MYTKTFIKGTVSTISSKPPFKREIPNLEECSVQCTVYYVHHMIWSLSVQFERKWFNYFLPLVLTEWSLAWSFLTGPIIKWHFLVCPNMVLPVLIRPIQIWPVWICPLLFYPDITHHLLIGHVLFRPILLRPVLDCPSPYLILPVLIHPMLIGSCPNPSYTDLTYPYPTYTALTCPNPSYTDLPCSNPYYPPLSCHKPFSNLPGNVPSLTDLSLPVLSWSSLSKIIVSLSLTCPYPSFPDLACPKSLYPYLWHVLTSPFLI